MDEIDHAFRKLYGKLPTYLERDQFLKARKRNSAYITEEDALRISERVASNSWKTISEREKSEKSKLKKPA